MDPDEFLIRLKMVHKVTSASNLKAAGLHFNKKSSKAAISATAETAKSDFISAAMKYNEFVLGEVLRHTGLSSDIVKCLAAFEPFIVLKRPVEVALRHFDTLFSTFQLRSWVSLSNEAVFRDEYVGLLDHLRTSHSSSFDLPDSSPDLIDFLMGLDFFQTHEYVSYLFRLCCLCVTSVSPQYPAVTMGKIDTTVLRSRMADVIFPCQSYLSEVPGSLVFCSSEASFDKFSLLSTSFGQTGASSDYDPTRGHLWIISGVRQSITL